MKTEYEKKVNAASVIIRFMGELARKHTAVQMRYLWKSMDGMIQRYGTVFVADAIAKDHSGAILALWTFGKGKGIAG